MQLKRLMAFGLRTELFVKPGSFDHRREKIEQNTTNKASNVVHGLEQSLFLSLSGRAGRWVLGVFG